MDEPVTAAPAPPPTGPPAPSPRRALAEVLGVAVILAAVMTAWSATGWSEALRERSAGLAVVATVGLLGLVSLAAVRLVVGRSAGWRAPLGLRRAPSPLVELACGLGAVPVLYAATIAASIAYVLLADKSLAELAAERREAIFLLSSVPVALVVPIALFVAFYEEGLFRGFFLSRLEIVAQGLGPPLARGVAVLVSSLVFGLLHAYQGPLGVIQTGLVGLCLAVLATWRRSTWAAMVAHCAIDVIGLSLVRWVRPLLERALETS